MAQDVRLQGASSVLMFSTARAAGIRLAPGNDNHPPEPVKTVTVRKKLELSGVSVKIKVPVDEFVGVAVSTTITEDGVLSSAIDLIHGDPNLNYRVFEELGNSDVVAEWQNWGKKLRLPLFIRTGDGSLLPYSQQVDGIAIGENNQRRRTAGQANRRPRFLNRRKPGNTESA
jgi:Family of unknown function (DUF6101)